ncbi:unnamed protein product [Rhizoctonia solani]|uniref:Transmembrane protein n=1 Tax=Rhizoctonia solani TaxID=456999 RepID=A0A8H2XTW9_9AGAM|nr:unnamed protein product [Rhizoctonia solani]
MLAFSRITSILLFVLSLSFLACALPTSAANSNAVVVRDQSAQLLNICANLEADVKAKVNTVDIATVKVLADVEPVLVAIIAIVNVAIKAIIAIGANINIAVDVKAQVAVHIAACIRLIVNLCVSLVAKLGVTVLLAILVKIDVCLQLLLTNLAVVVDGIVVLVAKLLLDLTVQVFVNIRLNLCLSVLGLVGLSL